MLQTLFKKRGRSTNLKNGDHKFTKFKNQICDRGGIKFQENTHPGDLEQVTFPQSP
jgi:hypothetical protein